ncbi:zinc finger protein CONSTANS-LIKE 3-like [Apium graveolens]|uniref:zinc finger protein CONSTANS-LIKE 3-like n=1 Tax=Apium graveolens TaxID=4045 RepID=UPI003D7A0A5E
MRDGYEIDWIKSMSKKVNNTSTFIHHHTTSSTPQPFIHKLKYHTQKLLVMGVGSKSCESCKTSPATLFCKADSAFLCVVCDGKIHAANKLASRHPRVWMCEVCENSPASVTCKADAAALCVACDRDIHSANPLARRHKRVPVVPFYDATASAASRSGGAGDGDDDQDRYFTDPELEEEEAEAASWLLPNPNNQPLSTNNLANHNNNEYLLNHHQDLDCSFLDIDVMNNTNAAGGGMPADHKPMNLLDNGNYGGNADGVVPVQSYQTQPAAALVDGFPAYNLDYCGSRPFMYNFNSQSISQSVSSSSLDVGLVPDHNAMTDVSNTITQTPAVEPLPNPVSGLDREARVMRYREKRKNRKFEKTIRYASRKAYAETRPRIKGRFAKRSEIGDDVEALISTATYGVVPSY